MAVLPMKGLRKFLMGNRDKKMKKGKNGKEKIELHCLQKRRLPKSKVFL